MASTMNVCRTALLRRALASASASSSSSTFSSSITSRAATSPLRSSVLSSSFSTSSTLRNAAAADAPSQDASDATPAPAEGDAAVAPSAAISSCPEGTVLVGLNYTKGKTDPVAKRDEDYPAWLWKCLDVMKKTAAVEEDAGDEFSKSKKQRRLALKRQRELEAKIMATGDLTALAPKIPMQHQTIDLPVGVARAEGEEPATILDDTLEAATKRRELRMALRKERRAKIKENNYLRSM